MNILTCDSSSRRAAFGLVRAGSFAGEVVATPLAETFPDAVDQLLQDADLTLKKIDLFAVVQGPGSFTGLRVGLSVMKVWSYIYRKPLVGVSTLAAMAESYNVDEDRQIIAPAIDAASNEYYVAAFEKQNGQLKRLIIDQLVHADQLLTTLPQDATLITGEVEKLQTVAEGCQSVTITPMAIANLADQALKKGKPLDLAAQPIYLKLSAAEQRFGPAEGL